MNIDSAQLYLAVVRGILATIVVFAVARLYEKYLPKGSWLYRMWHSNERTRVFLLKYYWVGWPFDFSN